MGQMGKTLLRDMRGSWRRGPDASVGKALEKVVIIEWCHSGLEPESFSFVDSRWRKISKLK